MLHYDCTITELLGTANLVSEKLHTFLYVYLELSKHILKAHAIAHAQLTNVLLRHILGKCDEKNGQGESEMLGWLLLGCKFIDKVVRQLDHAKVTSRMLPLGGSSLN